jgi:hypothetical protein
MTKELYHGEFPMDQLPTLQPGAYIINTDDSDGPGQHWLAVYVDDDIVEYFDSYGLPPCDSRLERFLGKCYVYNAIPLQQIFSNACGFYCVYYILHRARNYSMIDIINVLKKSDGDFVVKDFLYRHYKPVFNY